jgi:hypothetical protein
MLAVLEWWFFLSLGLKEPLIPLETHHAPAAIQQATDAQPYPVWLGNTCQGFWDLFCLYMSLKALMRVRY